MQKRLFLKIMTLGVLLLLFAIGLGFVKVVVHERQNYQSQVIHDIERHQIGTQKIISPFITVPYKEIAECSDAAPSTNMPQKKCEVIAEQLFFPEQMNWDADFEVSNDKYHRTIYHATSYLSQLHAKGTFQNFELQQREYDWNAAKFILPINDLRGIRQKPILTINSKKYQLDFPKQLNYRSTFNYLEVSLADFQPQDFEFIMDMNLEGLQSFALIPTTENSILTAKGNWEHAKYFGDSLPQSKDSQNGTFQAEWQNITLGYQYRQSLMNCWNLQQCASTFGYSPKRHAHAEIAYEPISPNLGFAVKFIEPINIYSLTDRAIKYGWIITLITFGCFFLFEVIKSLRIHPIQYLLVGVAQSIFFVLLLSISEQFNFLLAYNIASVACIGLISWYLSFVLNSWKSTLLFTVLLSSLYGVMYVLLQSSEKTFLMGSIFSFVLVAAVMFITRHIDWYQLGIKKQELN